MLSRVIPKHYWDNLDSASVTDYLANEHSPRDRDPATSADFDAAGNDLHPFAVLQLLPTKP